MSDGNWSLAQLREALKRGDLNALRDAGIIDKTSMNVLLNLKQHHPEGLESEPAQRIIERSTSHTLRESLDNGQIEKAIFAVGMVGDQNQIDAAEWNRYEAIKDLFRQEPRVTDLTNNIFQCVLFSNKVPPTGRGKTATAYWLTEVAQTVYPNIRVVTNNDNDPFETVPKNWDDIETMIKSHDGWMLLLLDEMSQFMMYADQGAGKSMSNMLKLLRHNDTHLIGIGHTGADVPQDIRRQVYVMNKTSDKSGELGYGIEKNGDDVNVANPIFKINSIPMTDIDYGGKGDPAINIEFGSNSGAGSGIDEKQCVAETNAGDECPNQAKFPADDPQVCYNHRHKIDDD